MQAARTIPGLMAALALSAGCGQPRTPAAAGSPPAAPSELNYQPAPELLAARVVRGRLELAGDAAPGAPVRLASPSGPPLYAVADASGAWRVAIAQTSAPRLLSLSMSHAGRPVWAVGYLFVAPDGTTVRLRSGGGSEALAAPQQGPARLALDYDRRGGATLTGFVKPGEAVSLRVDGIERGQARADADGRFIVALNEPLLPGPHAFDLMGAGGDARFTQALGAPAPLTGAPFSAGRAGAGWRIDWLTPGGGEQTTLVFGPAG